MNISFLDIKRKDFKIVLRGYAKEEVDAFLEKLAIDVNALLKENEKLKKDLGTAVEKINEYRKMEKNRQEILIKAQENATRAIESQKSRPACW
jgi:cell division initiation protein